MTTNHTIHEQASWAWHAPQNKMNHALIKFLVQCSKNSVLSEQLPANLFFCKIKLAFQQIDVEMQLPWQLVSIQAICNDLRSTAHWSTGRPLQVC